MLPDPKRVTNRNTIRERAIQRSFERSLAIGRKRPMSGSIYNLSLRN